MSATHLPAEEFAVTVHGRAVEVDVADPADAGFRSTLIEVYGPRYGYEGWEGFSEYHKIGYDECESFDYEAYKANGFEVVDAHEAALGAEPRGLAF